jgi:hypothetical protein
MKVKNKIEYGNIEVDEDLGQVPMIRTTIFLDVDLKRQIQNSANEKGVKYQQLIREVLRSYLSNEDSLEKRVEQLEKIVLQKRA